MTCCPECGGPALPQPCEELFGAVLALDHSRRPPWGPLHGITVSCFLLQHPSRLPRNAPAFPCLMLHTYLDEGLTAVTRLIGRARRSNSHRSRGLQLPEIDTGAPEPHLAPSPTDFGVTIHDVGQDGTFPADGFPERITAWASDIITAWCSRNPGTCPNPGAHRSPR